MDDEKYVTTDDFCKIAGVTKVILTRRAENYPPRHRSGGKGAGQGAPHRYAKADIEVWQRFKGALRSVEEHEAAMAHERAAGRG